MINITKITNLKLDSSNKVSPENISDSDEEIDVFISEHLQQFMSVTNLMTSFLITGFRQKLQEDEEIIIDSAEEGLLGK